MTNLGSSHDNIHPKTATQDYTLDMIISPRNYETRPCLAHRYANNSHLELQLPSSLLCTLLFSNPLFLNISGSHLHLHGVGQHLLQRPHWERLLQDEGADSQVRGHILDRGQKKSVNVQKTWKFTLALLNSRSISLSYETSCVRRIMFVVLETALKKIHFLFRYAFKLFNIML